MMHNELRGIRVGEQSQPTLEGNTCEGNRGSGIAYFGEASGTAKNNTCRGNGRYDIYVAKGTKPSLIANRGKIHYAR